MNAASPRVGFHRSRDFDAGPETEWRRLCVTLTQAFPMRRASITYVLDTFPGAKRKDEAKLDGNCCTERTIRKIYAFHFLEWRECNATAQ